MKILVTGAAGFIGFHLVKALAVKGHEIVGIDNINDYYPVSLKYGRLAATGIAPDLIVQGKAVESTAISGYRFCRVDITDKEALESLCRNECFDLIVNLAAQAGVRYSIENPMAYIDSNVVGFMNILECCRNYKIGGLVYASSSSVYGGNDKTPFSEDDRVDNQVSIYAATKKSNELMANVYAHLFGLSVTGLRFFTVYGPWGRPDMAPMLFTKAILEGKPIKVFNNGDLSRDFTYIDDIVEGIVKVVEGRQHPSVAKVYNIGHGSPVQLMDFIQTLEDAIGKNANMDYQPMQPGDVYTTYADTTKLKEDFGYEAETSITDGIKAFVDWYREFYS